MTEDLEYIYEDEDILVCHKPAGMATEGARVGRMDLISRVRNYLARRDNANNKGRQRNLPPYVATINRLDQPVEGVLVLAKNKKAAGNLASQIKNKYYSALCYGTLSEDRGRLTDYIIRRESDGLAQIITREESLSYKDDSVTLSTGETVRTTGGEPKKAELEYRVITSKDMATLLEIHLLTGRFHQIRAQLSHLGHPILGDSRYANPDSEQYSAVRSIDKVCLAAFSFP